MLRSGSPRLSAWLALCLALGCSAAAPDGAPRVVLVGLDGADWETIHALFEEGRLPHLEALVEGGASGVLHTVEPMLSPMLWTSIATGRTPPEHGILDFFAADAEGRRVPVPSHRRRVRALWNIAGDHGHRVAFVGWQVTHPAERVEGIMVSDRVLALADERRTPGRGVVHPAELEPELAARVVAPEAVPRALLRRFLADGGAGDAAARRDLGLVLAHTETLRAIALALVSRGVDLLGVYFPGIDEVSHRFARFAPPRLPGVSEEEGRAFGGVVEEFYVYQDEIVGEIAEAAGPGATIYVVSDHGFRTGRDRPRLEPSSKGTPYAARWHRDNGVIAVKGPGIRSGHRLRGASLFDVTPTILAQLGIPPAEDMAGEVLSELWASAAALPVERVPSHERAGWREETFPAAPGSGDELDAAEALASRLRALGYLGDVDEPANPLRQAATESTNLAGYHLQQGELEPALEAARRALRDDPGNTTAWRHLASILRRLGDPAGALRAIDTCISLREDASEPHLFRIELLREAGALAEATRAAEALALRQPGDARVHGLLGRLHAASGSAERAIESFRTSLALDPGQEDVTVELFSSLLEEGDAAEVERRLAAGEPGSGVDPRLALGQAYLRRRDLDRALHYVELSLRDRPDVAQAHLYRGVLLGERRDYGRSLQAFDRALALAPDYVEAHFNKGVTQLRAGQLPGAIESLEVAAELMPASDSILANLGKAYALHRDYARARAVLERALRINPESEMARTYWAQVALR